MVAPMGYASTCLSPTNGLLIGHFQRPFPQDSRLNPVSGVGRDSITFQAQQLAQLHQAISKLGDSLAIKITGAGQRSQGHIAALDTAVGNHRICERLEPPRQHPRMRIGQFVAAGLITWAEYVL